MSAWDTDAVKIGKNVSRGGAGPRETVVRGKSALNAAQRSGAIIATEKKYGAGNTVRIHRPHAPLFVVTLAAVQTSS